MIRAARYLGVPPWELMKQPHVWQQWALEAEAAEAAAEKKHREDARRQEEMRRKFRGK